MGRPESSAATYSVRTPAAQNALRWATSTASLPETRESSSSKPMNDSGSRRSMRTGIRAALTSGNRLRSALKPKEALDDQRRRSTSRVSSRTPTRPRTPIRRRALLTAPYWHFQQQRQHRERGSNDAVSAVRTFGALRRKTRGSRRPLGEEVPANRESRRPDSNRGPLHYE